MCFVRGLLRTAAAVVTLGVAAVGCGSSEPDVATDAAAAPSSTGLECDGEREQLLEADLYLEGPGAATQEQAGTDALAFYVDRHGGEVAMLRPDAYGLQVTGRTVVVADVTAAPTGGYWVTSLHLCESFMPVDTGPPETLPLVTST